MLDILQRLRRACDGMFRPPAVGGAGDGPSDDGVAAHDIPAPELGGLLRALLCRDVRPQLDTLEGFAELLASAEGENLAPPARAAHAATILACARAARLALEDLHDALRLDGGAMRLVEREIDAAELIEATCRRQRARAMPAGGTIVFDLVDGVSLRCDPDRIGKAVARLLAFAGRTAGKDAVLLLAMARPEGGGLWLSLAVAAGAGPAETDLGLWLARQVARLHGGGLELEVTSGNAVTVRFIMPPARIAWPPATRTVSHAA